MTLEAIVRPFTRPTSKRHTLFIVKFVEPETDTTSKDAVLTWKASTALQIETGQRQTSPQKPNDNCGFEEDSRKTSTKRIENPNDSSQFVDVEVIGAISFRRSGHGAEDIAGAIRRVSQELSDTAKEMESEISRIARTFAITSCVKDNYTLKN